MLIDLRHGSQGVPESAEALIIGAGAVGLTMAVELARAGRRVIVLEAGGRVVDSESQDFFNLAQWRGRTLRGLHVGRYRALGGTTNFWGGQLLEFDSIVFENRPWASDIAWPITRQDLEPHYRRGYELLGMGHYLRDDLVWSRLNIAPPVPRDSLEVFFSAWAPQPNFASLFKKEIASDANLCVVVNAPVVALDVDRESERVTAALVRMVDGATHRFSAQRVVLANGTVEIARLLKLPAVDGRAPWADNQWLGKGFTDHIDLLAGHVTPLDQKRFHDLFDNAYIDRIKYVPKLKLSAKAQRERELLGATAFFLFDSKFQDHLENAKLLARSLLRGQFQREVLANPLELLSTVRVAMPMVVRYLRDRRMFSPADEGVQLRLMSEQFPIPQSAIHLSERRDRLGMPIVEIDWRIDGREIETLAVLAELIADYLETHQLATARLDPALVARDRQILNQFNDYCHHMGMARMAEASGNGVVDRDLKVFGTRNLYVAGAAVYPSSGFANPTFTAIALGLRLAHGLG
jgi:hypothetical protein